MTAKTIMQPAPITVADSVPVGEAINLLFQKQVKTVPVVDSSGKYRGLFGIHTLVRALLPRAATLDQGASLRDLGFVHDTLPMVQDRVRAELNRPVIDYIDRQLEPLHPDDSLMKTLLQLHQHRHALPVADPKSGKLLGIVTYWSVLTSITGRTS